MKNNIRRKGYFLPLVLFLASIVFIVTTALIALSFSNYHLAKKQNSSLSALNIAEAGINYYLWHLSHNNQDYCDGTACSGGGPYGPFLHEYKDTNGVKAGEYTLTITPPTNGGNTVMIRSEAQKDPTGEKRTVVATLGMPSFARYSFVTNSETWFGTNESTKGLAHSNKGIRYDGTADGIVSSAVPSYKPSTCMGGDGSTTHNGIWDAVTRDASDQTRSYWTFPVPTIDFNKITTDFSDLKLKSKETGGLYLPALVDNRNRRTDDGYLVELNGTTLRVSKVTADLDSGRSGNNPNDCGYHQRHRSLINRTTYVADYPLPTNGILFVEDNMWIRGNLNGRLTVASARLPDVASTNTYIYLQNDITYAAYDGTSSLGLISQSDIVVNSNSENDLRLDAFMLSQKGQVFRPLYNNNVKNSIYVYGGIGTYNWWTWSWVSGNTVTSGYRTTTQEYDNNLALTPPPGFPTTGSYAVLSWKEEPIL